MPVLSLCCSVLQSELTVSTLPYEKLRMRLKFVQLSATLYEHEKPASFYLKFGELISCLAEGFAFDLIGQRF